MAKSQISEHQLEIHQRKIEDLHLDPANVRTHPNRNLESIKASLVKWGQQKPIVVSEDDIVIAGNGVLMAAKELGWDEVQVVQSNLDGVDLVGYAIADNRISELSEWDYEPLSEQLAELVNGGITGEELGWTDSELTPLLNAEWQPPEIKPLPTGDTSGGTIIKVSVEQMEVIGMAIDKMKEKEEEDLSDGRCIELICADWMSSPDN